MHENKKNSHILLKSLIDRWAQSTAKHNTKPIAASIGGHHLTKESFKLIEFCKRAKTNFNFSVHTHIHNEHAEHIDVVNSMLKQLMAFSETMK